MFSNVISKIICYMCGDGHKRFTKCERCNKIFCGDCKSTVFTSGGRTCFWCVKKKYQKQN